MIGAILNPKKSFELECSSEQLNKKLKYLPAFDDSYTYSLTEDNEVLKMCTYEATETLSLGVYIDVTITSVSDNKCSVEVEVRRKLGSFDKSHEVSAAGRHIQAIAKLIGNLKEADISIIEEVAALKIEAFGKEYMQAEKNKRINKVMMNIGIITLLIIIFIGLVIYLNQK